MERLAFVNRVRELSRLRRALSRPGGALIVVYGRRRCGKSRLGAAMGATLPAVPIRVDSVLPFRPRQRCLDWRRYRPVSPCSRMPGDGGMAAAGRPSPAPTDAGTLRIGNRLPGGAAPQGFPYRGVTCPECGAATTLPPVRGARGPNFARKPPSNHLPYVANGVTLQSLGVALQWKIGKLLQPFRPPQWQPLRSVARWWRF